MAIALRKRSAGQRREPAEAIRLEMRIGVKLRHARMVRGLTLKQLAEAVGCSESLVSKVENGKANPSLTMLHRIASALGTNIGALFAVGGEEDRVVFRPHERPTIVTDQLRRGEGIRLERLIPYANGHLLEGTIHLVAPGGRSEGDIEHEGEELGYVLEGEIELTVDGQTYSVRAGDSFNFRSELPHSYRNPGTRAARIIWINTPPTF